MRCREGEGAIFIYPYVPRRRTRQRNSYKSVFTKCVALPMQGTLPSVRAQSQLHRDKEHISPSADKEGSKREIFISNCVSKSSCTSFDSR